jgi:hypothetical protein
LTSKRTSQSGSGKTGSTQAGSSGPAPRSTGNYGLAPTKQTTAGPQPRIIREAPKVAARPSEDQEAHRRARLAADRAAAGEDEPARAATPGQNRVRPRPSDEMVKRRAARKARGVVDHGFDKRLSVDEATLDTDNYAYYWATADQVARLEQREYEVVPPEEMRGQDAARHAGNDRNDKPTQQVLMRKLKEWDEEDRAERLKLNREQDEALLRGTANSLKDGDQGGVDYVPKGNKMSIEERTH